MEGIGEGVAGVELLLLGVGAGDDGPEELLDVLDGDEVGGSLALPEEEYEGDVAPPLVLQEHLPEAEEQPPLPLDRPVVLSGVADEDVPQLLGVEAELADHLLHQDLLRYVVQHHHPRSVDLPVLDLHLLRQEVAVEAVQEVRVRLVENLGRLVQQEDQLLLAEDFLALDLALFDGLGRPHLQGLKEERVEFGEGELGVEYAPVQQQGDYLAVLEEVGLRLGEGGNQVAYLVLVALGEDKRLRAPSVLHRSYIILFITSPPSQPSHPQQRPRQPTVIKTFH